VLLWCRFAVQGNKGRSDKLLGISLPRFHCHHLPEFDNAFYSALSCFWECSRISVIDLLVSERNSRIPRFGILSHYYWTLYVLMCSFARPLKIIEGSRKSLSHAKLSFINHERQMHVSAHSKVVNALTLLIIRTSRAIIYALTIRRGHWTILDSKRCKFSHNCDNRGQLDIFHVIARMPILDNQLRAPWSR